MRNFFLLLALGLVLILSACGQNPIEEAQARAIDAETAATRTATGLDQRERAIDMDDGAAVLAATQDDRIAQQENLIWWSTVAGVVVILSLAASVAVVSIGGSRALAARAMLRANLVWLDKTTRTWPVMLDTKTGILVDLETGERARLGDVSAIDHRRLIISGQVRTTGLLAQTAQDIAKSAKDAKPGDMLAAIGQSVPLLKEAEEMDGTALAVPARQDAALPRSAAWEEP